MVDEWKYRVGDRVLVIDTGSDEKPFFGTVLAVRPMFGGKPGTLIGVTVRPDGKKFRYSYREEDLLPTTMTQLLRELRG